MVSKAKEIIDYIEQSKEVKEYLSGPLPLIANPSPPHEVYGPIFIHFVKKYRGKVDPQLLKDFIFSYIRLV